MQKFLKRWAVATAAVFILGVAVYIADSGWNWERIPGQDPIPLTIVALRVAILCMGIGVILAAAFSFVTSFGHTDVAATFRRVCREMKGRSEAQAAADAEAKAKTLSARQDNSRPHGGNSMKRATKLRVFGGMILLVNLWLIGHYNMEGIPVLLLTVGFAIGYELIVVRPLSRESNAQAHAVPVAGQLTLNDDQAKGSHHSLNGKQRTVLKVAAAAIAAMLAFPPFHIRLPSGVIHNLGYAFILDPPSYGRLLGSVDFSILIVQWIAVAVVAAVFLWLAKDGSL